MDTEFDSFMKTDVQASLMRDTFLEALQERAVDERRRLQEVPAAARRLEGIQVLYKQFDLEIVYEMEGGSLFEVETLQRIVNFE